jgi:hypothetical protein
MDWLKLMNFEVLATVEFGLDSFKSNYGSFEFSMSSWLAIAYGVKAVKRQYSLIPLEPVTESNKKIVTAGAVMGVLSPNDY